ncbi:coiled-coil domain-containing protein [Planoprotostelium fungivorum]|uniref:Coiled-coil domain-containing protein n=1 Tax=Planoprotostelium fungivorum TaxID=1890364 RepID=A0A2P6MM59_9EUKA|nr:coiled-coil domain-containing protein [Planoprotostelium fungivorum]
MADRRATNKYYPPEWDPSKGSINTFVGQHPLRDRARKLKTEGILVVRFEMPYNIWCGGCHQHIGKGVRFNAEKKQAGNYYSTKIWNFGMKCHLCSHRIEIETDPKNHDYIIKVGADRKTETWDSAETGIIQLEGEEHAQKMAEDPFFRLENSAKDVEKAKEKVPQLEDLIEFAKSRSDTREMSSMLRADFRKKRKELEDMDRQGKAIGLPMPLLPVSETDREEAKEVVFRKDKNALVQDLKKRRLQVASASIFGNDKNNQLKKTKINLLSSAQKNQQPLLSLLKPSRTVVDSQKKGLKVLSNTKT